MECSFNDDVHLNDFQEKLNSSLSFGGPEESVTRCYFNLFRVLSSQETRVVWKTDEEDLAKC